MSEVSITINKRAYTVYCDDGQEAHLKSLAERVDGHVGELVSTMGQIGDQRLLVMASLMLADELADVHSEQQRAQDANRGAEIMSAPEASVVRGIESLASRIDTIASEIERATEALVPADDPPAEPPREQKSAAAISAAGKLAAASKTQSGRSSPPKGED